MNSLILGNLADEFSIWGVNVLLQATVAAAVAMTIGLGLRRSPTLRYGVLLAGLALILLTPLTAGVMQWSGRSWWSLSVMQVAVQPVSGPGAVTPPTATEPVAVYQLPASHEEFDAFLRKGGHLIRDDRESFADGPFPLADNRQRGADVLADELPPFHHVSTLSPADSQRNFFNPRAMASWFEAALRTAVPPLLIIWFTGSAILLARLIVTYCRLARLLRTAKPNAEAAIDVSFAQAGRTLQLQKLPELVLSDRVSGPFSAGLIRPRVVLPERIVRRLTPQQLRDVLLHEAAHIVRCDQAIVLLQNIAAAVFWLHPLVKAMTGQLAQASEEVCDNYVLAATDAPSYSRTLLMLAKLAQSSSPLPGAVALFTSRWKLESRVAGLLDERRSRGTSLTRRGWAFVGVVAVALAVATTFGTISVAVGGNDDDAATKASAKNRRATEATETTPDDDLPTPNLTVLMPDQSPVAEDDALPEGAVVRLGSDRFRQEGEVQEVRYSHDGKKLASISRDSLIICDARTGKRLKRLRPRAIQDIRKTFSECPSRQTARKSRRQTTRECMCGRWTQDWNCFLFESKLRLTVMSKSVTRRTGGNWPSQES